MSPREIEAFRCAQALLQAGFTDYADAILRGSLGRASAPVLRLLERGATPQAMAAMKEALSENG